MAVMRVEGRYQYCEWKVDGSDASERSMAENTQSWWREMNAVIELKVDVFPIDRQVDVVTLFGSETFEGILRISPARERKECRIRSPAGPLFSGWNWQAHTRPRCTCERYRWAQCRDISVYDREYASW